MSENSLKYMEMALQIGFSRLGKTSPNPPVGAVIVKNGEIISTGGTFPCGFDHAEVCAIKNAGQDIAGAEMYVSLEPCCHHSKRTPPCTDAIKAANISRVYIPVLDPNPEVAGKGVETLRAAGVEVVIMSEMSERAFDLIRYFTKYIIKNTPYVIHKSAFTLDGRIASKNGESKWISSEYSRYISHKLRSLVDAIIIGKNTLMTDNPSLNIRLESFPDEVKKYFFTDFIISGKESFFLEMLLQSRETELGAFPLRVCIGLPDKIDISENFYKDNNFLIFANESQKEEKLKDEIMRKLYDANNLVFIKGRSGIEQTEYILAELYNRGKMMLLLEGGGRVAGSFFSAEKIDQFLYFITPKIIGDGINVINTDLIKSISESKILYDVSTVMLKDDILYNAYSDTIFGLCRVNECIQE